MVKIISDSTCDLSEELIKQYDIAILPLHIVLGEQEYLDGQNITPEEIYHWSDMHKTTPKTSAISMEDAISLIRLYLEANQEIIMFCISEQMSTTGNVMRMAAKELNAQQQVFVINSENLSTGLGLLVLEAAIMAHNGCNGATITQKIEQLKPFVRASFVVDTLTYLHRGGRCNSITALAGSMLKLHPKIVVDHGEMRATKKYRGKMSNVLLNYVHDLESELKAARKQHVFITHSGCNQTIIETVYNYLQQLNLFKNIYVTQAGGVISSHCGPGTLGVLFIEDQTN